VTDLTVSAVGLRVEHFDGAPLTVHTSTPRLSWRIETERPAWVQAAWELEAVDEVGKPLWQSGRQDGRESVLVPWGGEPLASRARCTWRVRVWGTDGSASEWSDPGAFEVGLLDPGDWTAVAVSPGWDEDVSAAQPCPYLRSAFTIDGDPVRARLHVTAHGIYEASINGTVVGDQRLAPGWTAYKTRLHVQTFDVTGLVRSGDNEIGALLGDGWWRGNLGWVDNRNLYGETLALLAQLEVDLADGSRVVVGTDESWEGATGPVLAADLYDGETHDARIEPGPWSPVRTTALDLGRLVPQSTPPVRVTEVVRPTAITTSPAGRTIVDFGQNLVGVLRIRVEGPAGTTIVLRHAEILEDGELCTRILRSAKATDRYTLRGDGPEEWSPRFTSHGFRYAEVEGWPGELTVDDIDALVMHSDMTRTGWFECSDDLVNQLHENIVWGWRGNTVSVPTDCPQRDERLGWTGDIQVFTPTASFLYDTAGFLGGWLRDLAADQLPNGCVTAVVPDALLGMPMYAAGWGDAATVVPTALHQWYGDRGVLEAQLDSMKGWVDSIADRAGPSRLWNNDAQFGDWVDPTVDPHTPGNARTDSALVATAYFARSADLVADAADVLGRDEIATEYRKLAAEVRAAWRHEWVAPSGRVVSDTQTGCSLALAFHLIEDEHRPLVGKRLHELVGAERHRLSTGFLGTPVLNPALTEAGYTPDAYKLLLQTRPPSWLYPVTVGATTIWERWEALQLDGTLSPGSEMLSFNHYALGAVGEWLHRTVGGLASLEPGFGRFRVAPQPGVGISSASTVFDARHGRIAVRWSLAGRGVEVHVTVPPNTEAEVVLPGRDGAPILVGSGEHLWRYPIDHDQYRHWVPARYTLSTPSGELRGDPAAWAIVEQHAPDVAVRYHDALAGSPLTAVALGSSGRQRLAESPIAHELAALTPVPDPPEESGFDAPTLR
jgi:alpha-L-rhamnosidase